jgi:hypothetical protein
MESSQDKMEKFIAQKKSIEIFLPVDFLEFGSRDGIDQALRRLVKKGVLVRLAQGIYIRKKYSELLRVNLVPSVEEIVRAIARREKRIVQPSGAMAANLLGLSLQVPARYVFLTTGTAKKFKLGKTTIEFRPTTPKALAGAGTVSGLVVHALKYLGKDYITEDVVKKLRGLLKAEDKKALRSLIKFVPAWMVQPIKAITNPEEGLNG